VVRRERDGIHRYVHLSTGNYNVSTTRLYTDLGLLTWDVDFGGVGIGDTAQRVLLHDPAILILDEATASVDPFTELQIQEGLDRVMHGRTSIVIAHRLSTVRNADRIIVLQRGQIIEQGDHAALLRRGGHYAELYNTYFRHQSLSYIEQVGHH